MHRIASKTTHSHLGFHYPRGASSTSISSSSRRRRVAQLTTHLTIPASSSEASSSSSSPPYGTSSSSSSRKMTTDSAAAAAAGAAAQPAPWRDLFLEHVSGMPSPEFVLSTVRRIPLSSSSSSPSTLPAHGSSSTTTSTAAAAAAAATRYAYVPRARTCVFRGLWAELPANPKNGAPRNPPDVYGSDMPTFTTDARMAKVEELWGHGGEDEGTGGGAAVEAVWWARGPKTQWRVRGEAYVLAPGDVGGGGDAEAEATVGKLRARMRRLGVTATTNDGDDGRKKTKKKDGNEERETEKEKEKEKEWSFAREIAAHFGNLSPAMRGSFRNPPPGAPLRPVGGDRDGDGYGDGDGDSLGLGLGQKVADLEDEVARANFRVVVVMPREVDRCDLSDPDRARRWLYTFVGAGGGGGEEKEKGGGEWEVVEVWP